MRLLRCQRGSVNQAESASRLGKGKVHPGAGLRRAERRVGRHAGGRYAHKEKDFVSLKRVEPREIVSDRHFPWLLFFSNRVRVSKAPIEVPVVGMHKRIGARSIAPNYSDRAFDILTLVENCVMAESSADGTF